MATEKKRNPFEIERGDRMATYREIRVAVTEHLKKVKATAGPYIEEGDSLYRTLDYFSYGGGDRPANLDIPIPDFQWLSCFAVPGSSEGYYIHVEAIDKEGPRTIILLGKTFHGFRQAYEVASEIAHFLYGY